MAEHHLALVIARLLIFGSHQVVIISEVVDPFLLLCPFSLSSRPFFLLEYAHALENVV